MKKTTIAIMSLLVAASVSMAGALNQFKAGDISFSVLDKDGATPMQSTSIKALDATSGDVVAEVVSDDLGQAVLALDAGRYLLNVSDVNLAIFDVDASEGLSLCRVIMPDTSLLAGGQEGSGEGVGEAAGSGLPTAAVAVGAVIVVAAIGAGIWAIVENNDDDDHKSSDQKVEVAETQTKSAGKSSSKKKSSSSSEAAQPSQPVNPSAR